MSPMRLSVATALAALMTVSTAAGQTTAPTPPAVEPPAQDQGTQGGVQGDQPDRMRGDGMRGEEARGDGMRGDRMRPRDRRGMMMHRQMMKIVFAITDADNDGALSFEEISTIHRRVFDKVDVNRDGKVTPDEIQDFFHD